jgi:hypothetical protein
MLKHEFIQLDEQVEVGGKPSGRAMGMGKIGTLFKNEKKENGIRRKMENYSVAKSRNKTIDILSS